MKVKYNIVNDLENVKHIDINIGEHTYRISESIDNKLNINKSSDSSDEILRIYPRYSNVIEIQ